MVKKRKIYHLFNKVKNKNEYYNSLAAMYRDNELIIHVSKYTLDRWDWSKPYKDANVEISKSFIKNNKTITL